MATIKLENNIFYLYDSSRSKVVGTLNSSTRTLCILRNSKIDLFKPWKAYGINVDLLDMDQYYDNVHVKTDHGEFRVPRVDLLSGGRARAVPQGERQMFISIDKLNLYRINGN